MDNIGNYLITFADGAPGLVKVSSTDTTPDFLLSKLVAGSNINFIHNSIGGNESITINSTGGGSSGTSIENTYIAGSILGSNRLVMLSSGQVLYFDSTDVLNWGLAIGFTKTSATLGNPVVVIEEGIVNNPGWGLTPGAIYYATTLGLITTVPPVGSGMTVKAGIAIDSDNLRINILDEIILT